jgi:uncharacterized protein YwgA
MKIRTKWDMNNTKWDMNNLINKKAKKHLKSIEWLFDSGEFTGNGRTRLLIYVFIKKAMENGIVRIMDHDIYGEMDTYLAIRIKAIVKDLELPLKINMKTLIMTLKK